MVFYFTGTGNSLYIAKQIEKNPLSIPQMIHRKPLNYQDDSIGIVSPVYGHELPRMVKDFLQKAVFQSKYFYIILTYGNRHGGAAELAKNFCDNCGIKVNYINVIQMVDNWLPGFDMEEEKKTDKNIERQLLHIIDDLNAGKNMIARVTEEDRAAQQQLLERMNQTLPRLWQHLFKITEHCIGCGICQKVCPSASTQLMEGTAVYFSGNCQTCLACVHACPQKAIALTIPEKNPRARYRNEHISLQEIISANCQFSSR